MNVVSSFILLMLPLLLMAQANLCLYFPLETGSKWRFINEMNSDTLTSMVVDTVTIKQKHYYVFALYGQGQNTQWLKYFLRPDSNKIFALNLQDSSEYLLFNFTCEAETVWQIPPDSANAFKLPVNQCDWGSKISLVKRNDSLFTQKRNYYDVFSFSHSDHPCYDAGISSTWFSRDLGIVKMAQITEGGVSDWFLDIKNDTLDLIGKYTAVGNPCLTIPCLPGIVGAIQSDGRTYLLEKKGKWSWNASFVWDNYQPELGDSVKVKGIYTERTDIQGKTFSSIEVLDFKRYQPTSLEDSDQILNVNSFALHSNFPNPFNSSTKIRFTMFRRGYVQIELFSLTGTRVRQIFAGILARGEQAILFNDPALSSGLYFYSIRVKNGLSQTGKMLLIR